MPALIKQKHLLSIRRDNSFGDLEQLMLILIQTQLQVLASIKHRLQVNNAT